MARIIIRDIKNITNLDFEMPHPGVHILTGTNGSGKTTLMTCLARIGNPLAFRRDFKTSSNNQFDSFRNGSIVYSNQTGEVTYRYRKSKWAPTPKKGATCLPGYGFNGLVYISSDVDRFYVQDQELFTRNIQAAHQFFRETMNSIFGTTKFDGLRKLKISGKGKGDHRRNVAFLLPTSTGSRASNYYSEKNFSLGEVMVLNALFQLLYAPDNALVLVDEVELALHPKVQIRFYQFLKQQATAKTFTVIISTHSSSLIKAGKRCIFLDKDTTTGTVLVRYNCFPAVILKEIAFEEDFLPDYLFCVEDDQAGLLWGAMLKMYFANLPGTIAPEYKAVAVGGWPNVFKFRNDVSTTIFPPTVRVYAIPDADSSSEVRDLNRKTDKTVAENELVQQITRAGQRLVYLPITPELGLKAFYDGCGITKDIFFQGRFEAGNLHFSAIMENERMENGNRRPQNPRTAAKKWFGNIVGRVRDITNWEPSRIERVFYDDYVNSTYTGDQGALRAIMGPIFNGIA